ncbi:TerB N-terminal domain-containing protein [Alkalihalophilus marmarensis]|uniref:TerB N-terminal domain-containing protein n=1 Tax=Alkalihalophilus marmarensis DSM 21297 TaxID=1188261 RepID=U6SI69_9BACI|nr:TerB N-terminal domain-containing protein [Alkalihalophilus marmarensis]ERN51288.1 hypothetical protein A33I_20630 [Alkalihalophilus marmarensis DSM 21297]
MGLFDSIKKFIGNRDKLPEQKQQAKPTNLPSIKKHHKITDPSRAFIIHSDIENLIWIKNGPKQNYLPETKSSESFAVGNYNITISFLGMEEPSLIDMNAEMKEPKDYVSVARPPYYPSYSSLNPEQKYIYWRFLGNPYESQADISYVFLLYYGLERHLFTHDFERSIEVILKLREVHTNESFQSYSGNAIVLSCLLHQRADLMTLFIQSLNEEYKRKFSASLYLLAIHSFDKPLEAQDLTRLAKTFGFTKINYIKEYPDLFNGYLEQYMQETFNRELLILSELLPDINDLPLVEMRLFANVSLSDKTIKVPDLTKSDTIQKTIFNLLNNAHESVKKKLVEMRKKNMVPKKKETNKPKKKLQFNSSEERRLLGELKKYYNRPIDRHFTLIQLQDFYYKYRELDDKYLQECIKYCYADIDTLEELNKAYIKNEIDRVKKIADLKPEKEVEIEISEIKQKQFYYNIPAFKRLAIIYEKSSQFDYAIDICKQAVKYYSERGVDTEEFEKRMMKLTEKTK